MLLWASMKEEVCQGRAQRGADCQRLATKAPQSTATRSFRSFDLQGGISNVSDPDKEKAGVYRFSYKEEKL